MIPSGDVYGGGAPTGIVFNEGDGLGRKYRGLLLSAEAARNTIFGYFPKPDGAGYKLERFDFLTSNKAQAFAGTDFKGGKVNEEIQTFFRPSDVAVGPDGAIYVADWFDPRVGGHDDKDDTTSGAIYRIAPKGFVPRVPAFDAATLEGQVTALRSAAVNVRQLGFDGARRARRGGVPAVRAVARATRTRTFARVPCGCSRGSGPRASRGSSGCLASDDRDAARHRLPRAAPGEPGGSRTRRGWRAILRPPCGAKWRCRCAMCRSTMSREVLLALAQGYDGKDRSYLEAWGIGATDKEEALYARAHQRPRRRNAAQWPTQLLGSGVAPYATRGA